MIVDGIQRKDDRFLSNAHYDSKYNRETNISEIDTKFAYPGDLILKGVVGMSDLNVEHPDFGSSERPSRQMFYEMKERFAQGVLRLKEKQSKNSISRTRDMRR